MKDSNDCSRGRAVRREPADARADLASGSSHREAPYITEPQGRCHRLLHVPQLRAGRDGYVTLIANYLPLQDPYGGPNYFALDPEALYEIHIDNTATRART